MKQYAKLYVDAEAYYSGNTYYEEVFLPLDVWEEIKGSFNPYIYLSEFDGKHSEVKVSVEVAIVSENRLRTYIPPQSDDGEQLFYHIYEYLDEDRFDRNYLMGIQVEVFNLCQVEEMTIRFNSDDRETILSLLEGYILKEGK